MKLPVAFSLGNRQASLSKDALMRNALAEPDEALQIIRARKRPSIVEAYTAATGTGQALFVWNIPGPLAPTQILVAITDDTIDTAPTPVASQILFTVQPS
jgi:hypothetical protein